MRMRQRRTSKESLPDSLVHQINPMTRRPLGVIARRLDLRDSYERPYVGTHRPATPGTCPPCECSWSGGMNVPEPNFAMGEESLEIRPLENQAAIHPMVPPGHHRVGEPDRPVDVVNEAPTSSASETNREPCRSSHREPRLGALAIALVSVSGDGTDRSFRRRVSGGLHDHAVGVARRGRLAGRALSRGRFRRTDRQRHGPSRRA
jgi:hypothetical protein